MANELNTQAVNNSQVLSAWPTKRDSGQAAGSPGSGSVSSQGGTGKADRVSGLTSASGTASPDAVAQASAAVSANSNTAKSSAEKDTKLKESVEKINSYMQSMRRELQFSVDKDTGLTVVKVVNPTNSETIRQIPSEEVLSLAKRLVELGNEGEKAKAVSGLLLETQA